LVGESAAMAATSPGQRKLPPVLGRLLSGSFWLALRTPMQAVVALWTIPLIVQAIGKAGSAAYFFAWGFGLFQMLLEFGMSSALQRQVSETWTRGDHKGVNRAIACGMNFYTAMALVQVAALLIVAYVALPYTGFADSPYYHLIVQLLWLQAVTAPCYGISIVVSSVLLAARRYDFIPRLDLLVIVLRFAILYVGVNARVNFLTIVIAQTVVQIGLTLVPGLWVMVRELGHVPHFAGARLVDYKALAHISFYMFLIQLSVVLADKVDTTILGFALVNPEDATNVYTMVSKPFSLIRQSGWTLAYMVLPAMASLVAAQDDRQIERIKYDGTRLHVAALLPVGLLAWVYAAPFLTLWMGDRFGHDAGRDAWLLRLFLVATIPLVLSVPVQMGFGVGKVKVVALAALGGALINLPLSTVLTLKLQGPAGVIWGTVLTTLFSNLLIPGVYLFRALDIRPRTFLSRTLSAPAAGAVVLLATTWLLRRAMPLHPSVVGGMSLARWLPLMIHVVAGCLAYVAGYIAVPTGRTDLVTILGKARRRTGF
jgi:O-antigen/teichoic acid export membrane protein